MANNSDENNDRTALPGNSGRPRRVTKESTAGGNIQAAATLASGELKYRPMRVWSKRQKAKREAEKQLGETAYSLLENDSAKDAIVNAIDECLTDDINQFMDKNVPRSFYPYPERVQAAITRVFSDNLKLFGGIGALGTDEIGQEVDCFGQPLDGPVLEELLKLE